MEYWDSVRSIVLISLMLNRSPSSVQTQASRKGLPRRHEDSDRHRRRWTQNDRAELDRAVAELTLPDGRIPIERVAERVGRSIDAVASRLAADLADPSELLNRIVLPAAPGGSAPGEAAKRPPARSRKTGQTRACLSCRKPFWSEGAHNRICSGCKREQSGWDWAGW